MSNQGTIRLKVTNDAPAIEKLWNGRFRLEFLCDNNSPKTDWYSENISSILPDYGILQDTNFGSGVSEDWEAIPGSVYPDMRLVETEYVYIPSMGDKRVKLTYETLTAAWVEEKAEDTDYELNGLKRVSRTFVALPGTAYDKVIGTSTIDSNGTTLYLGSFKVEETDAKWSLSEVWLEAGELSREENSEDAKGSISITQIGGCAAAPAGYTVVNESKNNTQGFETCSRTFYKDNSELSRSNDYVGSQLAENIEVFSPTSEPTPTNGTAVLGNKSTSNVDGIPTIRYTFLVPSVLSESSDRVGSQLAITVEAFNEIPATPTGYVIASEQTSDVEGIPTTRYTFLKPSVLSQSNDYVGSQLGIVIESFSEVPVAPNGYSLANEQVSDFEGIKTTRYSYLKDGAIMSESFNNEAEGIMRVTTTFFKTEGTTVGPIIARRTDDVDGIPTISVTTLQDKDGNALGANGSVPVSQFDQYVAFRYPGEVSIATDVDNINSPTTDNVATTWTSHWYSLIPPVTSEINARVYVFFQTVDSIVPSDLTYDGAVGLWNPTEWAKGRVDGLGTNYKLTTIRQTAQDKVFNEYTVVAGGDNSVSGTAGYADATTAILLEGSYILPDASYSLTVSGGPGRPDGIKYVVQAPKLTPAFDDVDGNQVWKKTIIVATIPTR